MYFRLLSVLIPLSLKLKLLIKRIKLKHYEMNVSLTNKKNLNSQEHNHAKN